MDSQITNCSCRRHNEVHRRRLDGVRLDVLKKIEAKHTSVHYPIVFFFMSKFVSQSLIFGIATQNSVSQVLLHRRLLLLVGKNVNRAQPIHNVLRLPEINLVKRVADLVLHIFDHPPDVGNVR